MFMLVTFSIQNGRTTHHGGKTPEQRQTKKPGQAREEEGPVEEHGNGMTKPTVAPKAKQNTKENSKQSVPTTI